MKISVLTPTYNRAYVLPNLYKSIINNKCDTLDIEWIIMDDGSTDDTESLVKQWITENKIYINYHKQNNQGKMVALNNSLQYITGNILIECDSDDYFTDNCFDQILTKWPDIDKDPSISGLAFLRVTKDNKPIGTSFMEEGKVSTIFDMYFKEGVEGDKCLVFKSSIRKKYKHKLEHHERFVTEGRMYHEMDLAYRGLKCYNIPGAYCEYLEDGYTKNITTFFKNNPYGYYHYYLEMFRFSMKGVPFKIRMHIIKHYILFSYLVYQKKINVINETKGIINKILVTVLVIPGYILTKIKFNR